MRLIFYTSVIAGAGEQLLKMLETLIPKDDIEVYLTLEQLKTSLKPPRDDLSMVVIAALIGAGGLGVPVFQGLNSLQVGLAGVGGLSIVLMAMVLDRITQALATPKTK